ncbi:vesicle transporter SFT2B [Cryptococcus deuterogattii 99/473]|uniref:Protein transport protein SFT2 n=5 Tax=Cryptococcus gattii species complex TaxID=1884637 RepID=A0A0D0T6H1_9TREE|nr:vesicle transporter SFT2B [Cryptococcus deuterogattii R265]KIR29189.1 vesicle transporter SFT2B [Cryptococcus deuterogattii LA55]KIR34133.1 vesicle transporter SFT2B [Cryptococcus deuterogattii MMRL2647]KIR41482.1 vesicle transporter SFT2B [Cryptococcus deuterogattii Ram5]KIR71724.1 vesicle transporter SFT2B [Cryptococcus deuterogattii CA1014]KIR91307.1 vesicle transporter SFT2B [Cryptococcus deuterogattii CBS 10090]KIR98505.1 vesicle transporter SFT2B [Cryptococcus deuterogattii 2001/935-
MSSRKWYNLEAQTDDAIFGGNESAFSALGLTRTQRLGGFAACFVGGLAISLLGAILLFLGATGAFATLFAVGGIISLIGTGFLIGFKTQLEKMFKPVRIVATVLMLASIVMTFVSAFVLPTILCIIFVIIQYLAYLWYALSYIPYARTMVKNMVGM